MFGESKFGKVTSVILVSGKGKLKNREAITGTRLWRDQNRRLCPWESAAYLRKPMSVPPGPSPLPTWESLGFCESLLGLLSLRMELCPLQKKVQPPLISFSLYFLSVLFWEAAPVCAGISLIAVIELKDILGTGQAEMQMLTWAGSANEACFIERRKAGVLVGTDWRL